MIAALTAPPPCGCPDVAFPWPDDPESDSMVRLRADCACGRRWRLTLTFMAEPTGRFLADNLEVA